MGVKRLFDDWPERYDRWFDAPLGKAVLNYECTLVLDFLRPAPGELILDAGSGTGIFTREILGRGAEVVGSDISLAMLRRAEEKAAAYPHRWVAADMVCLPFADGSFDKAVCVTALEFVADERPALAELFRVTRSGGVVVAATLNSLSPWALRRREQALREPGSVFNRAVFRSPAQLLAAVPVPGVVRTAVHFGKEDDPEELDRIEREGQGHDTGAFVAARWIKP